MIRKYNEQDLDDLLAAWEAASEVGHPFLTAEFLASALFVHPSHHKRGVGRGLMDKARELRGELEVEVFTANTVGRAFYAKYGFQPVEEKVHEQTGLDLVRMRLSSPITGT